MILTFLLSNCGFIFAMYPSSVVHTGVKSRGCENSTAHESPIQSWKRIRPSVVSASKSGAVSPIVRLIRCLLSNRIRGPHETARCGPSAADWTAREIQPTKLACGRGQAAGPRCGSGCGGPASRTTACSRRAERGGRAEVVGIGSTRRTCLQSSAFRSGLSPDIPPSGYRARARRPPKRPYVRPVGAADTLDRALTIRVTVELHDERPAIGVAQLLG